MGRRQGAIGRMLAFRFTDLALFFLSGLFFAAQAEQVPGRAAQMWQGRENAALWRLIDEADVMYIGETHDQAADHAYELRLVHGLIRRGVDFSVGWEMFDRTQQVLLDAWNQGAISRRQLFQATGFERGWEGYSSVYATILETVKRSGRKNAALNAPSVLVRKVARGQRLSRQERALLPHGFETDQAAYQNFVGLMGEHPGLEVDRIRTLFAAQNVWDQTMADRIVEFHRLRPRTKLVVLTGRGHVAGGFGIPFYVKQKGSVRQLILLP